MVDITLALDAMGGDNGLSVTIPAAIQALKRYENLKLILVGDEKQIEDELTHCHHLNDLRIDILHASEVVLMDEAPSSALRNKKDSSMRKAINLVKEGKADACVSAGNTGALMATARFVLKTLPGIDRPAIISELPTVKGKTRVLDLGANVDSCAEHLFQFSVMGTVLASAIDKIKNPTVALLNIGAEGIKGNYQVKHTATLLSKSDDINYIGFVEGDDIFKGTVDIVVCDGFVGNTTVKATEGVAKLLIGYMREAFTQNIFYKMIGFLAKPVLKILKKKMDPSRYNGASLLGLNGIVVKSHGGANVLGFRYAIDEAIVEVEQNVPELIREQVADFLLIS